MRPCRRFQQSGAALVLEPVALALDADDGRMMQQPIQHRRGQHRVTGEGLIPLAEGQVRSQDRRPLLVAFSDDLEEQVGLFTPKRQVAVITRVLSPLCIVSGIGYPWLTPWRRR